MDVVERNLQEIGKSLLVTLPKQWTKSLGLKKGSVVKVMLSGNGQLIIAPQINAKEKRPEVTIVFDHHFPRHFFRQYFMGAEKITFLFRTGISLLEKERIYGFLARFMNVQIIEESESRIVTKVFRIEELSIEECLSRMHFLSLNILDDCIAHAPFADSDKILKTLKRFYYMLVMQVRRFIDEGRFADSNQISLLRAMDCRMAAEKVEKIAQGLVSLRRLNAPGKPLERFKEYYAHAFSCFLNQRYGKAVESWDEYDKQKSKCGSSFSLLGIIELAKEISMLVR